MFALVLGKPCFPKPDEFSAKHANVNMSPKIWNGSQGMFEIFPKNHSFLESISKDFLPLSSVWQQYKWLKINLVDPCFGLYQPFRQTFAGKQIAFPFRFCCALCQILNNLFQQQFVYIFFLWEFSAFIGIGKFCLLLDFNNSEDF